MRAALSLLFVPLLLPGQSEPAWMDADRTEPAGTHYRSFTSNTINADASYLIYFPPGYETAARRRYSVVYWLHGLGGNQRSGAVFVERLDSAIRAGVAPAMIAVLVNGMRDSRYVDSYDGKCPVETVIIKDLIPHIDATYRTVARREARAIEGFSMGGFGAARLGFKFPDLFGLVSIMAGALLDDGSVASSMHPELFQKNFGGNKEYFHQNSPWVLVEENAGRIRGRTAVRAGVGDKDNLRERDEKFSALLTRLKIEHQYFEVPGIAHEQQRFYTTLGDSAFEFYRKHLDRD